MKTHHVFISYSSKEKNIADAVCHKLEESGIKCWIAPRDIRPGSSYAKDIILGIEHSEIFLLIFSDKSQKSIWVKKEVERALSKGLTIIPFRIEEILPNEEMEFYISSAHWLDAFTPPIENHINDLVSIIAEKSVKSKVESNYNALSSEDWMKNRKLIEDEIFSITVEIKNTINNNNFERAAFLRDKKNALLDMIERKQFDEHRIKSIIDEKYQEKESSIIIDNIKNTESNKFEEEYSKIKLTETHIDEKREDAQENILKSNKSAKKLERELMSFEFANDYIDPRDGQKYKTVKIGNQVWMAENLKAEKFKNGDWIGMSASSLAWIMSGKYEDSAWCFYKNKKDNNELYGKLYNWYAVNDPRGLAPEGWKIPTDNDWDVLVSFLEGEHIEVKELKNSSEWSMSKLKSYNETKFTAYAGGYRISKISFLGLGYNGYSPLTLFPSSFFDIDRHSYWWCSTESDLNGAICRRLSYDSNRMHSLNHNKSYGFSVRCIKNH